MRNSNKRKIYVAVITTLSALSTHQFIDVYNKFTFLIIDILNNLTEDVVIYMIFVFLISITGYTAVVFNWKLLKNPSRISQTELIDDIEVKSPYRFWIPFYLYLSFSALITGLGAFLIVISIQQYTVINGLLGFLLPLIVATILIGLGVMFIIDGIKIRRTMKSPQYPDETSSF